MKGEQQKVIWLVLVHRKVAETTLKQEERRSKVLFTDFKPFLPLFFSLFAFCKSLRVSPRCESFPLSPSSPFNAKHFAFNGTFSALIFFPLLYRKLALALPRAWWIMEPSSH
jgi:hypothetical protein